MLVGNYDIYRYKYTQIMFTKILSSKYFFKYNLYTV